MVSDGWNPDLTIVLSGTGVSAGQLTSSATAVNFGSVVAVLAGYAVDRLLRDEARRSLSQRDYASKSLAERLATSGVEAGELIAAGQSAPFTLTFTPQSSGTASGSIFLSSNAANALTVETLTGSGTATLQHSVSLYWNSSTSAVVGYNVYRSATSGGPYTKVSPALDASTSYIDSSVQAGTTYYYVSTAVDISGVESEYSNQVQAVIPNP